MSFKENCVATCKNPYFADVCENRGDFKSRLTDQVSLMDGHVMKIMIFRLFSKLFRKMTWELKVAVLLNIDFLLAFVTYGSPAPTRVQRHSP